MAYEKKTWKNREEIPESELSQYPRFDAANMNRIEEGILAVHEEIEEVFAKHTDNKNNPHNVTAKQLGALSKSKTIDNQDILGLTEEGTYYSTRTVNTPTSESTGYVRVQVSTSETYRVVYWRPYNSKTEYINVLMNGDWLGWSELLTNKGGTLTGHLEFKSLQGSHAMKIGVSSDGASTLEHYTGGVLDGRLDLKAVEDNVAALRLRGNSSGGYYNVFGEHNKPAGRYSGNGSKDLRTVKIVGTCKGLLIWGTNSSGGSTCGVITERGGFAKVPGAGVLSVEPEMYCIKDGHLVINLSESKNNSWFNSEGKAYNYQVL